MAMEAIVARLTGDAEVMAKAGGRINAGAHPQGVSFPGLVINQVSGVSSYTLDGPSGVHTARAQVDCYAASYPNAVLLSRAVLAALSGFRGGVILGAFHAATRHGRESDHPERPFRVSLDFTLKHH